MRWSSRSSPAISLLRAAFSATIVSARPVAAEASLTCLANRMMIQPARSAPRGMAARRRVMPTIRRAARSGSPDGPEPTTDESIGSDSSGASSVGVGKNRRSILARVATLSCACQTRSYTGSVQPTCHKRLAGSARLAPFRTSVRSPEAARMRTYAPAEPGAVLDALLAEPSLARGVVHHAALPQRDAVFAEFPGWLDPRIVSGLASRGIQRPYLHQAEAMEAVHARAHLVTG